MQEVSTRRSQRSGEEWGAIFSVCERYRYLLWRRWDKNGGDLVAIGLNPSTATHEVNDPTNTRLMRFARERGYGGLVTLNLFAFRATDPRDLRKTDEPVGAKNDFYIKERTRKARRGSIIVAAWGNHGAYRGRSDEALRILDTATCHCFGLTKSGEPKHPLYLAADTPFERFLA